MSVPGSPGNRSPEASTWEWKQHARCVLTDDFSASISSTLPPLESEALRQSIQEVITLALSTLENRVTRYSEFLTSLARQGASVPPHVFQAMNETERSVKFYFDEKWRLLKDQLVLTGTLQWIPPSSDEPPCLLPEYEQAEPDEELDLHQRALAQCRDSFLWNLEVSNTRLLEHLVAADVMSRASAEGIAHQTRRERTLAVLKIAEELGREQFQRSFLPALKGDGANRPLAEQLENSMQELAKRPSSTAEARCRVCSLRERIDLDYLAPLLLERRLIPLDFYRTLTESSLAEEEAWARLFSVVGHTQQILPILSEHYPGVVMEMEEYDISSLECRVACLNARPPACLDTSFEDDGSDTARLSDSSSGIEKKSAARGRPILRHTRKDIPFSCDVCSLRDEVDPSHLTKELLSHGVIDQHLCSAIKQGSLAKEEMWRRILQPAREVSWPSLLRGKYPIVADKMIQQKMSTLKCLCLSQPTSPSSTDGNLRRKSGSTTLTDSSRRNIPQYAVKPAKTGICWIVVNSDSGRIIPRGRTWRKVCEKSAYKLQNTFSRLGFDIKRHENLSVRGLLEEAEKLANLDHSEYDSFACIVFAQYGDQDRILCSDGNSTSLSRLTDTFTASRCPTLAGKPKIFYRPGPRGPKTQGGFTVQSKDGPTSISDQADFVVIHSSPPECRSQKDRRTSALHHVERLTEVLDQHGRTKDFLTCLTMANSEAADCASSQVVFMSAPFQSTLRKSLVFGATY